MKSCLTATTALLALGLALPPFAAAQTPVQPAGAGEDAQTRTTDRVIVTAQKQEQDLIEVPINIAVADQARLDLLNTDEIEEFADFVPGLQVQAQSLNTSSYSLRGVTSDGGRPRVALFVNGAATGNPRSGANTAMFDLERIEVVKGPQATLFGQGALVGGINFLHNKAKLNRNEGWAKLDGGDYGYLRAEAGYNFAVSDTLAVRAAGLVRNRDGYAPNIHGNDLMGQDTTALRLVTAWEPSDAVRVDLFLNYQKDASTGTQFKSGVFPTPGGDVSPYTPAALNITPDQLRGGLGADREIFSETLNVEWTINDAWTLTSLTAHRFIDNLEAFDADGSALTLLQFATVDNAQTWSQDVRMNYDAGGDITAFFGANYYTQDASNLLRLSTDEARAQAFLSGQIAQATGLSVAQIEGLLTAYSVPGAANFDNLLNPMQYSAAFALAQYQLTNTINPALLIPLHGRHVEESFSNGDQTSYDIFGDISWKAADYLTFTAGLRYTWDELYSDTLIYLVRGNPYASGTLFCPFGACNAVTGTTTLVSADNTADPARRSYDADGELTWRFNVAYRVSPDVNTWFAVGRGRRPPSLSSRDCDVGDPGCDAVTADTGFEVVGQEIYDNIEVGVSAALMDNRLRFTASTYYGEYTDFQTTRYDVNQGSFITENSGNAATWGVEVDGEYQVNDYLDLIGSYAYSSAKYDHQDSDGNALAYAGNTFRLSPENAYSIAANLHAPVGAGEVSFVPTWVWKDDVFFEDDNDPNEFQEAYGLLDVKLGFDHASGNWGASLYVENALDEEYLIDGGNTGGEFGIPTYIRGVPRMVGAGAWVKF